MTNARNAKSAREKAAQLRAEQAKAEARRRNLMITIVGLLVVGVLVGGFLLIRKASDDQQTRAAAASAPPANLYENGILYGNSAAPVTLEFYEDFQCPACQSFEAANGATVDQLVQEGKAKVIYRPVAILDHQSTDNYSTRSAAAAAAVQNADPAAYKKFHDALYANQPAEGGAGLPDSQLVELAVAAGVDKTVIESAINAGQFQGWVTANTTAFGEKYRSTPTVLVNGTELENRSPQGLTDAVTKATPAGSTPAPQASSSPSAS